MNRNNLIFILSPIVFISIFIVVIFTCQVKTEKKVELEAPFHLRAKVNAQSIRLSWKWHGSSIGISGFVLERKTDDGEFKSIGLTSGFSFEDWKPPKEKIHIYRVKFFQGNERSQASNSIKVDLKTKVAKAAPTPTTTPKITPPKIILHATLTATPQKIPEKKPSPVPTPLKAAIRPPVYKEEPTTPGKPTPHPFDKLYKTIIDAPRNAHSGYIWFTPVASIVNSGTEFSIEVHANTGNQLIAAYGFDVVYDPAILEINKSIGENGVKPGKKGFVAAVNILPSGKLLVSGFDTHGKGPNINLHLVDIHFKAKKPGMTRLQLTLDNMVDPLTRPIGKGLGISGTIEVIRNPKDYLVQYDTGNGESTSRSETTKESYDNYDDDEDYSYDEDYYEDDYGYDDYNSPDEIDYGYDESEYSPSYNSEPEPEMVYSTPAPNTRDIPINKKTPKPASRSTQTEAPPVYHPPGAGKVWIEPRKINVSAGSDFSITIHVNSGDKKLAAYGFFLKYDADKIQPNTDKGTNKGVEKAKDGFVAAAKSTGTGELRISGFDVTGTGPGDDLTVVTVYFKAMHTGSTNIDLDVNALVDASAKTLGTITPQSARVTVN